MIVRIHINDLAAMEKFADVAGPNPGFALAVDDDSVPGFRLLLDSFPVINPADGTEIRRLDIQVRLKMEFHSFSAVNSVD